MNYSKFGSLNIKMTGISWDRDGLPSADGFTVDFDTLIENGIVEESDCGIDYTIDEGLLRDFSAERLHKIHGGVPKDFNFIFSIIP